jgi:hypothetical protein
LLRFASSRENQEKGLQGSQQEHDGHRSSELVFETVDSIAARLGVPTAVGPGDPAGRRMRSASEPGSRRDH